ncbi:MAG TPA: winged helix DNA-binding domain-containing protein [Gaiellaceae bacterium]|nr:winged helix DNA-binding domain-containing protein [Gaiellaceae bacterium]
MRRISAGERRARLARRHRLGPANGAGDPVEASRSVVALHSTDPVTVYLSVRARTDGVLPADVERALYDDRTLVRVLAMRRTLWVVPRDLLPVVLAAATRTVAERERRRLEGFVRDSGISARPAAWLARAEKAALAAVEARGEAFSTDVARDVPMLAKKLRLGAGTRWETTQSAAVRVLPQLAMDGKLVRGRPRTGWSNGQYRWVPAGAWLGGPVEQLEPAAAQAELLRRWLAAFGPGTETDLRWWTGWTARETRASLAAVAHEAVDLGGATGFVLAGDDEPVEPLEPWAALLPTLDPTTMGWKERDWYLGPHAGVLFDSNGNAGPTVWWDGRVVGGWGQRRDGEIVFRLLEEVGADGVTAVEAEAERLAAWVGDTRFTPGFLPPFQRVLAR